MKEYNGKPLVEGLLEEIKHVYRSDNRPWVIGYSGGKDSTVVVHLVYQMLKNLRPEERHKTVYIVSSDTLVENPLIKIYLDDMLHLLDTCKIAELRKEDKIAEGAIKRIQRTRDSNRIEQENRSQHTNNRNRCRDRSRQR